MWQVISNGLFEGLLYALVAVSFQLIYVPLRFFHFGHAAVLVVGAYGGYFGWSWIGGSFVFGLLFSAMSGALVGVVSYLLIFDALQRRRATPQVTLLASLGVFVILVNGASLVFGDEMRTISFGLTQKVVRVGDVYVTRVQILGAGIATVILILVGLWSRVAGSGLTLRAIGYDASLARAYGVRIGALVGTAFVAGSSMVGIAGFLLATDFGVHPQMGLKPLMLALVGMIVGGINTMKGAVVGGVAVGLLRQIGGWTIGAEWQDPLTLCILVLFLLYRPQGLLGASLRRERI